MPPLLALNVGNTRTQIGRFEEDELQATTRVANDDPAAVVEAIMAEWDAFKDRSEAVIAMASVADEVSAKLVSAIRDQLSTEVYLVGEDMPIPIGIQLDPETLTGTDRLLNAAAAYDNLKQACVVVDAGTAVTVDFVDGEGTFHGGAIAPGGRMQLAALAEHTSALPDLAFDRPEAETFGRSTAQAMLNGVFHGIRGLVWRLVERYADRYGAYPQVIATGGDAVLLFDEDELVDRIVPELTLLGIAACVRVALTADDDAAG